MITLRSLLQTLGPDTAVLCGEGSNTTVARVTHDSRQVEPDTLFACIRGASFDGHDFAALAVQAGAAALLTERQLDVDVPQVLVNDCRTVLGVVAAEVYGRPTDHVRMVGVTGTNGKTTTTHMLSAAFSALGDINEQIGTLSGVRTTPEAPELHERLAGFVDAGVTTVTMEVSSHALSMGRVNGFVYDAAIFTNLGRDHLDVHHTLDEYFAAKSILFTPDHTALAVINSDDPFGGQLAASADVPTATFSLDDVSEVTFNATSHSYRWRGRQIHVPVGGGFNVMNSLAALATIEALGLDIDRAVTGLAACPPVPGRFEVVANRADAPTVVVDYAHTPDGLLTLLASARSIAEGRVIAVFGCGGDRDRDKRPMMGAAAVGGADVVYVTSDNPRSEDPGSIIDEIIAGMPEHRRSVVRQQPDRDRSIEQAIASAGPSDIVVIAGKGHETTQTIGDADLAFDDRVVARRALDTHHGPTNPGDLT